MNIKQLKVELIGKKLLSIIDLNVTNEAIRTTLNKMTNRQDSESWGEGIQNANLLLFEENKAFLFIDFDNDGYRSGEWRLMYLEGILDKGCTKGIKHINSIVRAIEYFENANHIPDSHSDSECLLITTDEYVIRMGQDHSDSYYPRNFFDVQECKDFALGNISRYEDIKLR